MPPLLYAIHAEVAAASHAAPDLADLRRRWDAHVEQARARVPGVHVLGAGETLYTGSLSPGCQACKAGTWDCIFVTTRCNLRCDFCCSPESIPGDYVGSAFGTTPEQITRNHARTRITGVSFSGGEPFLEPDRLVAWLSWFRSHAPAPYTWLYTNGLLATPALLHRLGELGLDEIRFNMAATGYDHPLILEHLRAAVQAIRAVTVEIPVIPGDAERLRASLSVWAEAGVRFLNLHELMHEPGTRSASLPGSRTHSGGRLRVVTPDGHATAIDPDSRAVGLDIMQQVATQQLPLWVNDCSLQSKLLQVRGRRRSLAPLMQAPHEKLVDDRLYETVCVYRQDEVHFVHPDHLAAARARYPDHTVVRLARIAPLSITDKGTWVLFEPLEDH